MKEHPMIRSTTTILFLILSISLILQGCGQEETFSKKDTAIPVTLSRVTSTELPTGHS